MSEELSITLTWAALCAFSVVGVALVLDAVADKLLNSSAEEIAKVKAKKIVRSANRDLFVWRVKRAVRTVKFWNI